MRYRFRLDRGDAALPDPASRFQPDGPHGPSEIVDPEDFDWTDGGWSGVPREQLVIYEMHVGTFTPDGSWQAAARELPALAALGITCLEIMPVADFPAGSAGDMTASTCSRQRGSTAGPRISGASSIAPMLWASP